MARPQIPKRVGIDGRSVQDGTLTGPQIATNSAGLTQVPTAIERQVTVTSCGLTPSSAQNYLVFRAPPSGAEITAAYVSPGSAQNHAGNEADTWIFSLKNKTTGNALHAQACSLSNQTLAATGFKTIPINNGAATLLAGEMLRLEASVSGSPDALNFPVCVIEWVPKNNA